MRLLWIPLRPSRAFTLVEVAIAIAICVIVIGVIIGMLPSGQRSMRSAMDMTVVSQIARQISGDAKRAAPEGIVGQIDSGVRRGRLAIRHFTATGQEVDTDDVSKFYEAHTRFTLVDQLPDGEERMNTDGLALLSVEIVVPRGRAIPLIGDGSIDRSLVHGEVAAFPFALGGIAP